MNSDRLARRVFLQCSSGLAGGTVLRAAMPGLLALAQTACGARDEAAAFEQLSEREATEFAAIAARIIPTTDTPGAQDAGVIYFIDQAFGSLMKDRYAEAVADLDEFQRGVGKAFPGAKLFSELSEQQQDQFLAAHEDTSLFALLRRMTIFGFFGMQVYGGNHELIGWKMLGFEGRHAWQPPFGHYDAEKMQGTDHGG